MLRTSSVKRTSNKRWGSTRLKAAAVPGPSVDWHNNLQIHNRIAQDLDDLLYDFSKEHNVELDYDTIDKLIEQIKTVAIRRY